MLVTLYVIGRIMMMCLFTQTGNFCVDVVGDPALVIAIGGFEYVAEIMGIAIYRKRNEK